MQCHGIFNHPTKHGTSPVLHMGLCLLCIVLMMNETNHLSATDSSINVSKDKRLITAVRLSNLDLAKQALDGGADPNTLDSLENGHRLLNMAAAKGDKHMVELLLERGVEIDAKSGGDQTALMEAASRGYLEVARILLERGSDPKAADFDGFSALEGAAHGGYKEVVKLLLKKNPSCMAKTMAMTLAAYRGHSGVVKLLLDRGVPVDSRDYYGDTALITVARNGQDQVVKLLLDHGANPLLRSEQSHLTAREEANTNNHHAVVKILSAH